MQHGKCNAVQCMESASTTEMLGNISRLNLDPLLKLCQILTNVNANVNVRGIEYTVELLKCPLNDSSADIFISGNIVKISHKRL